MSPPGGVGESLLPSVQPPKSKLDQQLRRMPMKFRPLHDRVVVKRIDAEEKTAGGIIIPDTAKEKPPRARSSQLALAAATKPASCFRSISRSATACCSANGRALKSRSTTRSS